MVSSSLMQVAPLPAMHEQSKDIGSLEVTAGTHSSEKSPTNVYNHAVPAQHSKRLGENGFTQNGDSYSEPSTSESTDVSPRSDNTGLRIPEITEEFVDAPSMEEPGLQNKQLSPPKNLDVKEQSQGYSDGTKLEHQRKSSSETIRQGQDPMYHTSTVAASEKQQHQPTEKAMGEEQAADKSKKETLREPVTSAARSTASKRAAAVAAEELNDDVLVGTRVSEGHENFVTAYNMLTGIRVAVSRCTAKNKRPLTDSDFSATDEISFDLSGGGSNPSSKYMFHFKDYSPWVFRHLRDVFRLDPADYLMSLTSKYIVSELGSPGKSGSFFYYSRDYRFIIKTIRHSEHKLLRRILREYYGHVQSNPNTLISQFYGLHRVRLPFGRKIHFVVMNNVFPALYEIHERYDLKGSLLGREYRPDLTKPVVVYKDLDWLRRHRRIVLGPEKRERLVSQLEKDTRFLERVNVMDYSLLIGIHDMSKGNAALKALLKLEEFGPKNPKVSEYEKRDATEAINSSTGTLNKPNQSKWSPVSDKSRSAQKDFAELQMLLKKATPEKLKQFDFADEYRSEFYFYHDHGGFQSTNDQNEDLDVIYYVGVIDFLTGYTFRKSVETFCKSLIHDRRELSAVPSKEYGDRFLKFLRGCIGPVIPTTKVMKRTTDESQMNGEHDAREGQELQESSQYASRSGQNVAPTTPIIDSRHTTEIKIGSGSPPAMAATTPSPRKSTDTVTAVTGDFTNGKTEAKGLHLVPEMQRRSSVAVYGQNLSKEH